MVSVLLDRQTTDCCRSWLQVGTFACCVRCTPGLCAGTDSVRFVHNATRWDFFPLFCWPPHFSWRRTTPFWAPNLKCIALSAYNCNTCIDLDVKSPNTQTARSRTRTNTHTNAHTRTHTHTHTHTDTHTHTLTHRHLRAGGLKKKFSKRETFSRKIWKNWQRMCDG